MLGTQLLIGTAMIVVTVLIHVSGLLVVVMWIKRREAESPQNVSFGLATRIFLSSVLGVFFLHAIEIWSWAILYILLGQFETLERSLYFSTVTFTTVGYGDITLHKHWQFLCGLEGVNGVVLLGVSTAFLFTVLTHLFRETGKVE